MNTSKSQTSEIWVTNFLDQKVPKQPDQLLGQISPAIIHTCPRCGSLDVFISLNDKTIIFSCLDCHDNWSHK